MALPAIVAGIRTLSGAIGIARKLIGAGPIVKTTMKWHGRKVLRDIERGMEVRTKLAAQLLADKVRRNISVPVVKEVGPRSGRIQVTERSKPGEFPRADTSRLMRDIFWRMEGKTDAIVGTTLDYGLFLETKMDRSFLRRTLNEERRKIRKILINGPKLPGQKS